MGIHYSIWLGSFDENFSRNVSSIDASPGWVKSSSMMTWINWGWKSMDRGFWTTQFLPIYVEEPWLLLSKTENKCQNWKTTTKKIYLQSSGIKVYWWTYSRRITLRVVLFILYCYEYLKSSLLVFWSNFSKRCTTKIFINTQQSMRAFK